MVFCPLSQQRMLVLADLCMVGKLLTAPAFASRICRGSLRAPGAETGCSRPEYPPPGCRKGGELVRQLRREAAVKYAASDPG